MQYFGGKSKIATSLATYLESVRHGRPFIEPFVGGASVISRMGGVRFASDRHPYLIAMYKALQRGWIPPTSVSEVEYQQAKSGELPYYLTGFIGFGCSFGGKWFRGYAKNKRGSNYCSQSRNSLLKKLETLRDVVFTECDYRELSPSNSVIYCDPPYRDTEKYGLVGKFDSETFWDCMRKWSSNNTVIISEYNAPADFICVWSQKTTTELRNKRNQRDVRVERLFTYRLETE